MGNFSLCYMPAAAAIQENVGRQQGFFKHGISLVTTADFFSVSDRAKSFSTVSVEVARLCREYRFCLVNHLVNHKICHSDIALRELASKTLGTLLVDENGSVEKESCTGNQVDLLEFTAYANDVVIPRLAEQVLAVLQPAQIRHGSLLALSAIVAQGRVIFSEKNATLLRNLIPNGEKLRMYRGRGGETVRVGAMGLLGAICQSALKFPSPKTTAYYLNSMEECLGWSGEMRVQYVATQAVGQLLSSRGDGNVVGEFKKRLLGRLGRKAAVEDVAGVGASGAGVAGATTAAVPGMVRNGAVLGLGQCALFDAEFRDGVILQALERELTEFAQDDDADPITRQYAAFAIARVLEAVGGRCAAGFTGGGAGKEYLSAGVWEHRDVVFTALEAGVSDYSVDRRGDIGSWVREMCLDALALFAQFVVCYDQKILAPSGENEEGERDERQKHGEAEERTTKTTAERLLEKILGLVAQQCAEKINRTRIVALAAALRIVKALRGEIAVLPLETTASFQIAAAAANRQPITHLLQFVRREKAIVIRPTGSSSCKGSEHDTTVSFPSLSEKFAFLLDTTEAEDECGLFVFRKVLPILDLEEHLRAPLLHGLISSVGGVTESTSKASSSALLDYLKTSHPTLRVAVANTLNSVFANEPLTVRLGPALLNTVSLLLAHTLIPTSDGRSADSATSTHENPAALLFHSTHKLVAKKPVGSAKASHVHLLKASLPLFLGMLQFGDLKERALKAALQLCGHRYPKIREVAAQAVYVRLLQEGGGFVYREGDDVTEVHAEAVEKAGEILVETPWIEEDFVEPLTQVGDWARFVCYRMRGPHDGSVCMR